MEEQQEQEVVRSSHTTSNATPCNNATPPPQNRSTPLPPVSPAPLDAPARRVPKPPAHPVPVILVYCVVTITKDCFLFVENGAWAWFCVPVFSVLLGWGFAFTSNANREVAQRACEKAQIWPTTKGYFAGYGVLHYLTLGLTMADTVVSMATIRTLMDRETALTGLGLAWILQGCVVLVAIVHSVSWAFKQSSSSSLRRKRHRNGEPGYPTHAARDPSEFVHLDSSPTQRQQSYLAHNPGSPHPPGGSPEHQNQPQMDKPPATRQRKHNRLWLIAFIGIWLANVIQLIHLFNMAWNIGGKSEVIVQVALACKLVLFYAYHILLLSSVPVISFIGGCKGTASSNNYTCLLQSKLVIIYYSILNILILPSVLFVQIYKKTYKDDIWEGFQFGFNWALLVQSFVMLAVLRKKLFQLLSLLLHLANKYLATRHTSQRIVRMMSNIEKTLHPSLNTALLDCVKEFQLIMGQTDASPTAQRQEISNETKRVYYGKTVGYQAVFVEIHNYYTSCQITLANLCTVESKLLRLLNAAQSLLFSMRHGLAIVDPRELQQPQESSPSHSASQRASPALYLQQESTTNNTSSNMSPAPRIHSPLPPGASPPTSPPGNEFSRLMI
eukprot:TRINITY_DN67633_c6_g1_i1.p1 TRINITY_DN67633_c6_g1~~TRINITY_DN67633_c6_g1_i1.p1  ORF type:complete len:612 (+),score=30.12 TRINITY_DN67633_c6_g1_i1:47-1882(+)